MSAHIRSSNRFLIYAVLAIVCSLIISCNKPETREVRSLSGEWNFLIDSTSAGMSGMWPANGLPEGLIRKVIVPHTWNAERPLARYTGKAWYERKFNVTERQLKGMIRIQFDGVYHDAFVYVNGVKAGEHTGSGYNRFYIDATPYLKAGENRLTVCADNSFSRSNIPFMRSYDWANDGGIYRNVYEVITSKYAIRNIHVTATPQDGKGVAGISISFVDSSVINPSKLKLEATVSEENQSTKSVIFKGVLDGTFKNGIFTADLSLENIKLWHFDAPNLYRINVKMLSGGIEKDQYSTVFGFRTIKVENNRYVLNGEPMRLMGVEWMPGSRLDRGMAETREDFEANLNLMKNANCIFTRFHWQQDDYVFDWCDRHGILVQEEIPYWGIWTILNDTLLPLGIKHLDEMTDAHFNHPSIISWGIGNELLAHEPYIKEGLKTLYNHVKSLDPSRLSTYVSNSLFFEMPSENKERYDATADFDMMMFNEYYSSWYKKTISAIPGELDRIIGEYPGKTMTISEWGLCDPPKAEGDERRAREMARQIAIYGSKPYIAGAIYFCLNDYRTQRSENYSNGYPQRDHGVSDGYQRPKESYETLKLISSPIEIKNVTKKEGKITITLHGKTGIPSYTVRNYYIIAGTTKIPVNELKPGEDKTFEISNYSKDFRIYRHTGFEVLHIKL
jgi:beta-galactosidase